MEVGVIHHGAGNIRSVCRALDALGHTPIILRDGLAAASCGHLILPGVGAFAPAMANLGRAGLLEPIHRHIEAGRPLLGICLGAQLVMDWSEEFGITKGIGAIPGGTVRIEGTERLKVPHVGWARLNPAQSWTSTWLGDVTPGDYMYFTHSFVCQPASEGDVMATVEFGNRPLVAAVCRGNVVGVQFHPELSARAGLSILSRFLKS